jgi:serine/threonine protein phosphatase PrpC
MQGWRKTMEDSHIADINYFTNCSLFGVMDGHGGPEVAQYVKSNLPNVLKQSSHFTSKKWKELFISVFKEIDNSLLEDKGKKELKQYSQAVQPGNVRYVSEDEIYKHVGCTACIALISGDEFIVANTGDSRCVLCVDGDAVDMSVDHKPDNEEEKKRIEQAKGFVEECRVNGNLNLSRSLGDHEYKQDKSIPAEEQLITYVPDVKIHKITPKTEFAVIACDGIWEVWDSQKVIEFVRKRITGSAGLAGIIDELFEALISPDAVCNQFGCDNMTCIIIQFKSS